VYKKKAFQVFRQKNVAVGSTIVSVYIVFAFFAPLLAPYNPIKIDLANNLKSPSLEHPFGTDLLGRDILSRVIYGTRTSLLIGAIVIMVALSFGLLIGTISGYYGGLIDEITMRLVDILIAFPGILLAIAFVSVFGFGLTNLLIAVGISSVPDFARVIRAAVISVKENEYIEAARTIGEGDISIVLRYILPNCMAPIIVQSTLRMATAILWASALSFLGMGVQPPTPEWGADLSDGRNFLTTAPYLAIFPGVALLILVLGLNLLGDGLRDALDVRLRI
jgi:peptide/nickel transport system permease protein